MFVAKHIQHPMYAEFCRSLSRQYNFHLNSIKPGNKFKRKIRKDCNLGALF